MYYLLFAQMNSALNFWACILLYEVFIMEKKTILAWCGSTPVILAPRRMEQEDHEFEPSLGHR